MRDAMPPIAQCGQQAVDALFKLGVSRDDVVVVEGHGNGRSSSQSVDRACGLRCCDAGQGRARTAPSGACAGPLPWACVALGAGDDPRQEAPRAESDDPRRRSPRCSDRHPRPFWNAATRPWNSWRAARRPSGFA